jgi:RNA polymerase sigma factor (sigma-70 family)
MTVNAMDFHHFFERSFPRMMASALTLSGNRHDAEDAVQEAYAEAFRGWGTVGGYDAPDAWVHRVMRQRLWKAARRWRRVSSLEAVELATWLPANGDVEQSVQARAVLAELARLPDRQRITTVMYCLAGMSQDEIAGELGCTRTAVAQNIFKARRRLAKSLGVVHLGDRDGFDNLMTTDATWLAVVLSLVEQLVCRGVDDDERARDRVLRTVLARTSRGGDPSVACHGGVEEPR